MKPWPCFDKVLKHAPDIDEAVTGKGFALLGLGRMEEALQLPGLCRPFAAGDQRLILLIQK